MKRILIGVVLLLIFQFCTSELSEIDGVIGDHVTSDIGVGNVKIPTDAFLGQYFNTKEGGEPIASRIENRIRHDFNSPVRNDVSTAELSAKWTGDFFFETGNYSFSVKSDKGIVFMIDNRVVLNDEGNGESEEYTFEQQLDGVHQIVVEYNLEENADEGNSSSSSSTNSGGSTNTGGSVDSSSSSAGSSDISGNQGGSTDSGDSSDQGSASDVGTPIIPYLQVNGASWRQTSSVTVNSGDEIRFGPHPNKGGTWNWTGGGTSGTSREQVIYPTESVAATAIYTNDNGVESSQVFNVTVVNSQEANTSDSGSEQEPIVEVNNETPTIEVDWNNSDCKTNGGLANESGLKVWCWGDLSIPNYSGSKSASFSDGQLKIGSECNEQQISIVDDRLRFYLNPTDPPAKDWCSNKYNMRAEFQIEPWKVRHPRGTEEWFGWSYTFSDDYKIDPFHGFLFWQVITGDGGGPHVKLMVIDDHQFDPNHRAGELVVYNGGHSEQYGGDYAFTGITPKAGAKLDIVVHTIWDRGDKGWLQVWINGSKVYDKRVSTVYSSTPYGGNPKWGIYKGRHRDGANVQESLSSGYTHMETFMGPLRMITRYPDDENYGRNEYETVRPRD